MIRTTPGAAHIAANPFTPLVAIGASTGGPNAVAGILKALPENFAAAVVVVQHVGENFVDLMSQWLGTQTRLTVRVGRPGDRPAPGTVLFPDRHRHILVTPAQTIAYSDEAPIFAYRPSVDSFFHSVALHWLGPAVGVLLTGMGRDGAEGLLAMRNAGCHTIAQDEASCVIPNMPRAACALGAARQVLPLDQIAGAILARVALARPKK